MKMLMFCRLTEMINTVTNFKLYSILAKDYKVLKLIFISLTLYLIFDLFYDFLVVKPTYTSLGKRNVSIEGFPDITLCPEQVINISAAKSNGYLDLDEYFSGLYDG